MTRNAMLTYVSLPFVILFGIMVTGFVITHTSPPVPELEEMETFNWVHNQ